MDVEKPLSAKDAKKHEENQNLFFLMLTSRDFASIADTNDF